MTEYDVSTATAPSDSTLESESSTTEQYDDQCDFSPGEQKELLDTEEAIESLEEDEEIDDFENHSDTRAYPYDVPRPALTLDEASMILGKSIRSIERSIEGRWGNKLPEGWKARKMRIDGEVEWRIIPPVGFRVRHSINPEPVHEEPQQEPEANVDEPVESFEADQQEDKQDQVEETSSTSESSLQSGVFGFTLEKLIQTAGRKAKDEFVKAAERSLTVAEKTVEKESLEHPTIVIDRSDDVERLLRELADTQRELAEERRQHLDDLRLMSQMQKSMLLLEDHQSNTQMLKTELESARTHLAEHKQAYQEFLKLPWWKRLFVKTP